jgi:hypothetical protein
MLFFGAIMTPLVFTKLPPDVAGPFIRATFPRYYLYVITTAAVAAIGFTLRRQITPAIALAIIIALTIWLLLWLIPQLNTWRDAGNTAAFQRGHKLSVYINTAELLTALWLLIKSVI